MKAFQTGEKPDLTSFWSQSGPGQHRYRRRSIYSQALKWKSQMFLNYQNFVLSHIKFFINTTY